jgi:Rod binding domain-containing protein
MNRINANNLSIGPADRPAMSDQDKALREASRNLEAVFLSEMLKAAKFGETPETMGGGVGEDQFGSFLRDAQAKAIAQTQSIGLAEALFNAMKGSGNVEEN